VTTLREKPSAAERPVNPRPAGPGGGPWFHPHVVAAIGRRDFLRFFTNPAGYVFIALLVLASAVMAFWQHAFFSRNLDNLDTLNAAMPYLLLFFIPAVTMSVWADERKQGTDELLLTLPAADADLVLGKYLAAVGIFTVALAFMLPHLAMLIYLGRPDWGVFAATFFGYWLMGLMLIALGMVASQLSSNVTVAFILGAAFSAVPVFAGVVGAPLGAGVGRRVEDLSIPSQFQEFGTGVVPLSGVVYFVSAAAVLLYLNTLMLGRRHWAGGRSSGRRWGHALTRVASVLVGVLSMNALAGAAGLRGDWSEKHMHSLSGESAALIKQIPEDRPVYIQAFTSPDVPREFVQTKADLINLLKGFAAAGGDRVRLDLVETELYSPAARDAEKRFGIEPRRVPSSDQGRQSTDEIFLGVAFNSGLEEVVIPFFDRGLPVEYELTRSIRVVSRSARKKVGILGTDAKLMGGFDMKSMGQDPEWSIVTELKKQYEVSAVAPDVEAPTDLDVLLVAQPSSLTQKQIDNLTAYVRRGGPTLLFLDPLPVQNPSISPEAPRTPAGGPFGGGPPPEPKGDLKPLLAMLGVDWPTTEIVWNPYNPLKQQPDLPPEVVFVGDHAGVEDAFNKDDVVTSGLQEVVGIFAGLLRPKTGSGTEFIPLLRTDAQGGTLPWDRATRRGMFGGMSLSPERPHVPTDQSYTLAAHIKGDAPAAPAPAADKKDAAKPSEKFPGRLHAIAIADLDLISEEFFQIRRQKVENLDLDNVTFVLNCVDVLANDDAFVALRKRRLEHRTLETIERQSRQYIDQLQVETRRAEDEAKDQLATAQQGLDKEVAAVRGRTDVDERTKEILLANLEEVANRRLDVQKANIEDKKRRTILESKAESEQNMRQIRNRVRWLAVLCEPVPPVALGLIVFAFRLRRENTGANPNRLA